MLASVLRGLAPFLSPGQRRRALAVARSVLDNYELLEALCGLGPFLDEQARLEAAREALSIACRMSEEDDRSENPYDSPYYAMLLDDVAPWLPEASMEEALAMVAEAEIEEYVRVDALTELMPYLPDALKARALEIIWEPSAPSRFYHQMSDIAPHLSPDLAVRVYEAILERGDLAHHALTLVRLAPRLPEEIRPSGVHVALSALRDVEHLSVRAAWTAELAPHLSPGVRAKILADLLPEIRRVGDAGIRIHALIKVAPWLPDGEAALALRDAVVAARSFQKSTVRTCFLSDIVPSLAGAERTETLAEISALLDTPMPADLRNSLLSEIVPYLPDMAQADAIVSISETENNCTHHLSRFAPSLGSHAQREALSAAGRVTGLVQRAGVLREFAIHFTGEQKAEAIKALASMLAELAGTTPPTGAAEAEIDAALSEALEALSAAIE